MQKYANEYLQKQDYLKLKNMFYVLKSENYDNFFFESLGVIGCSCNILENQNLV